MGTRIALLLVWLLHFLPFRLLALVGHALGLVLFHLAGERRRVVLTNLALCFPHLPEADRRRLARAFRGVHAQRARSWHRMVVEP